MQLLYSEKHNAVAWPGIPDPERVAPAIPGSRVVKGVLVAPVNLIAQIAAAGLGLPVKSPIETSYDWPRSAAIDKPFEKQKEMAAFLTTNLRCHNLAEPRTGKTLANLWASDFLMMNDALKKALVVCPVGVMDVWVKNIGEHFPGRRRSCVLHAANPQSRRMKLKTEADYYIINFDGLKVEGIIEAIVDRGDISLVIVDESHNYRNPSNGRWKALHKLLKSLGNVPVWLNTGTPTPQEPTDAWGQQAIISKPTVSYRAFRNTVMRQVTAFKWVPVGNSDRIVGEFMQPAIRVRRTDCFDVPDVMYDPVHAQPTPAQVKALDALKKKMQTIMDSGAQITAVHEGALRTKILQILAGAVYDKDHVAHDIDASTRMQVLMDILDGCDKKVVIYSSFTSVLTRLAHDLKKQYSVAAIHGDVSMKERIEIIKAFQNEDDPRLLVADPRTVSEGQDFSRANRIIWYHPLDGGGNYVQANDRINGKGQTDKMCITQIFVDPLEHAIYSRNQARQSLQNLVMAWVKGEGYGTQ